MDPTRESILTKGDEPLKEQVDSSEQPSSQMQAQNLEENGSADVTAISNPEVNKAELPPRQENRPETDEREHEPALPWNNDGSGKAEENEEEEDDEDDVYSPPEPASEPSTQEEHYVNESKFHTDEKPAELNIERGNYPSSNDSLNEDKKVSIPDQPISTDPSVPTSGVDPKIKEPAPDRMYEPTPMNATNSIPPQFSSVHPLASTPNLDSILKGIDVNKVLATVNNNNRPSNVAFQNLNVQDRQSENTSSSSVSLSHSPNFSESVTIPKNFVPFSEYDPEEVPKSQDVEYNGKFPGPPYSDTHPPEPCLRFRPEDEETYQLFLQEEAKIMSNWFPGQFPSSSRLFLGHLQKENNLSKREVWKTFQNYGRLAQVVLKPTYGFVQFFTDEACARALNDMQGKYIQNQRLYLEISKLQKKYQNQVDFSKKGPTKGSSAPIYGSANPPTWKKRSRSPSLYSGKRPEKKPALEGLPRVQVDCHIFVVDDTPIEFVYRVENAFRERSLNVALTFLTPKLSLQALVHQCIVDGIPAIAYVSSRVSQNGCVSVQTFQRTENPSEIRYDEYANVGIYTAVELVLRSKSAWLVMNPSGFPTTTPINSYQTPSNDQISKIVSYSNPHLSSILGSLDSNSLHQLLDVIKTKPSSLSKPNYNPQNKYSLYEASNSNPTLSVNEHGLNNLPVAGAPSNHYPEQNQKQFEHILEQLTALQNP
ncbi:poly(A) binding protein Nab3 [Schizosaccharomyces octosporus yFS286]|uniref:Poly(A) binding protein Nab3 n=1 Tax=Schizosaccharomyces octosporus (strain yFS286) TaxID=483514 RepID=S9R8B7_SCHOY|nr:poly(A) binding protein Nab3 [Schizosaccharomyces octosporus yFS286]EPX74460.1 poly(A) binding protein Nab3 [Schizosaccharomyces octosporus yFS286]